MQKMVISVTDSGGVQHTLKDSFFNTQFLGNRTVKRMSEILFDEHFQKFYVQLLHNKLMWFNGSTLLLNPDGSTKLFDTYEQAVEEEIAFVNRFRKAGHLLS